MDNGLWTPVTPIFFPPCKGLSQAAYAFRPATRRRHNATRAVLPVKHEPIVETHVVVPRPIENVRSFRDAVQPDRFIARSACKPSSERAKPGINLVSWPGT